MGFEQLNISLIGPLRVSDDDGRDVTPRAPRVRGLLALLAEPPLRKRTRRWLVAHLWSDRAFDKSGMSLRNALFELRKALGPCRDAVCSDRTDVWLDPRRVRVDLGDAEDAPAGMMLLEGLDIADDAFEDWLRTIRNSFSLAPDPAPLSGGINVVSRVGTVTTSADRISAGILADQVSQNIEDMVGSVRSAAPLGRSDIEITTHMSETAETAMLSAQVVYGPTDTVLYSGYRELQRPSGRLLTSQQVAEFSHTVAMRALAKLPHVAPLNRDEIVALGFAEVARRRLFSYRPGEVEAAGALFERAFDADPCGTFLAWQAFQMTAMVIEGMAARTPERLDKAERLLRRAAELSPESAQVHGLVALVRLMLFDDVNAALTAAEAGLRRNPNCMLSRQAMAMTAGAFGDKQAAYTATLFCRRALENDDGRHLWDLYHGLVCIATDRLDEAMTALTHSARRCPTFKAPHRQLIALHMHDGAPDKARFHMAELEQLESGFTLDAYVNDPDYPADTLRNKGLLSQPFDRLI
ncbi:MAG: hypothetical protein AAF222_00470 [Pseudomonadota bacterium]